MATIIFNGKTYNSIEEMPPETRQAYEQVAGMLIDKNGNGIPDFLEGDIISNISTIYNSASKFTVNGMTYSNINELPPDMQAVVQNAFAKISDIGLAQGNSSFMSQSNTPQISQEPSFQSKPFVPPGSSAIQDGNSAGMMQWILFGIILFLCLIIAAFGIFFFLQQ